MTLAAVFQERVCKDAAQASSTYVFASTSITQIPVYKHRAT